MHRNVYNFVIGFLAALSLTFGLNACVSSSSNGNNALLPGFEVKMLVGSALEDFCNQSAQQLNQQRPKLDNGKEFHLTCVAQGSGDVVNSLVEHATQFKAGTLPADAPEFPSLISVDGEIYHSLLLARMEQLFPGQNYIPAITDAPLLVSSPMVFMTPVDLAPGLQKATDLFKVLGTAKTHQDIDSSSPPVTIHYVQTAPTRSNSGLQTLVAQYASVSGKRPEQLTTADVAQFTPAVTAIQQKVTRYGISTNSLAQAMVQNGAFWASVGSVYESSVIAANSGLQPGQTRYQAVYPKATFSSNMRAILPNAPWVSADEKAAAEQVIEFLRSPTTQQVATNLGLRPGTPGVALGPKFTAEFGVNPQATYDSYRPPQPAVTEAMLQSWQNTAKKPSQVILVVDSSGSMEGDKLPAVQATLQTYINNLTSKERVALIDFDTSIRPPVVIDGTPEGRTQGIAFVSSLFAEGGTSLYDASLEARNWLQQNLRSDAINAVIVLTDGEDSGSVTSFEQMQSDLKSSGIESDARISFFTVGYGNEGEFNPTVLQQMAEVTGGYYSKGDPATIAKVMDNLQLEF